MPRGGERLGVRVYSKKTLISINRIMKLHRIVVQKAMAEAITKTRLKAAEYLIPNRFDIKNPYLSRKKQPSVPGRLTVRTGKLKYMLRHYAISSNPLKHWTGFGSINAKQRSVAFLSQIKAERLTRETERYIGTIRVKIQGHPALFDTAFKMPQESLQTLAVRFNWETGIRGETRPIFKPVARETDFDMRRLTEQKNNLIWGVI